MPERLGIRVLSASAFERGGLRIDIPHYCAPSAVARREEFHLEQAAMLRLADVLKLVDGIRQTRPTDKTKRASVEVLIDDTWHDLATCLVQEGWGVCREPGDERPRYEFDPTNYPLKVDA